MDVAWLTSPEGRAAIAALAGTDPLRARAALPHLAAERISEALTQARHRPAGFPLPLVTVDGVQQASPVAVAQRRAARLAASGVTAVVDAGCGIGLDAWAFATAGISVIAYELDATTAEVARANLAGLDVQVRTADVTGATLPAGATVYVDPARRRGYQDSEGRPVRVRNPDQWRPPWAWVREHAGLARLAPGFRDLPDGAEWHCSSIGRSLVDATLWLPPHARTDRRASVLHAGVWHELTGPAAPVDAGPVDDYLLDPDPAIVRTGLVTNAAQTVGGRLLDEHLAFVTSSTPPPPWLGRTMRVLDEVPLRQVGAACRARGMRAVTVWARGFDRPPPVGMPQGRDGIVVAARLGPGRTTRAYVGVPAV
jgi:hypothetical protein